MDALEALFNQRGVHDDSFSKDSGVRDGTTQGDPGRHLGIPAAYRSQKPSYAQRAGPGEVPTVRRTGAQRHIDRHAARKPTAHPGSCPYLVRTSPGATHLYRAVGLTTDSGWLMTGAGSFPAPLFYTKLVLTAHITQLTKNKAYQSHIFCYS